MIEIKRIQPCDLAQKPSTRYYGGCFTSRSLDSGANPADLSQDQTWYALAAYDGASDWISSCAGDLFEAVCKSLSKAYQGRGASALFAQLPTDGIFCAGPGQRGVSGEAGLLLYRRENGGGLSLPLRQKAYYHDQSRTPLSWREIDEG